MNDYYIYEAAKQRAAELLQERRSQHVAAGLRDGRPPMSRPARVELACLLRRLANRIEPVTGVHA